MRFDDPGFNAALDRYITRDDRAEEDTSEMTAELDAAEAREGFSANFVAQIAEMNEMARIVVANSPCPGCGLPRGAHSDEALARCERGAELDGEGLCLRHGIDPAHCLCGVSR